MSYATGEAAILTTVRLLTNYWTTANTSRSNWRILNTGNAEAFCILRPGAASFRDESIGGISQSRTRVREWRTQVMVYRRYKDDTTTPTDIQSDVGRLVDHLENYPTMGSSAVRDAQVVGVEPLQQISTADGGPIWLLWPINIDWTETYTQ